MPIQFFVTADTAEQAEEASQFFAFIAETLDKNSSAEEPLETHTTDSKGNPIPASAARAAEAALLTETVQRRKPGRKSNAEKAAEAAKAAAQAGQQTAPTPLEEAIEKTKDAAPADDAMALLGGETETETEQEQATLDADAELLAMLTGEQPPASPQENPYKDWDFDRCWKHLSTQAQALTIHFLRPYMTKHKVNALNAIPLDGMREMLHEADIELARRAAEAPAA
jgi:hypothetical protein